MSHHRRIPGCPSSYRTPSCLIIPSCAHYPSSLPLHPRLLSSFAPLSRTWNRRASPAHFLYLCVPSARASSALLHVDLTSPRAIYERAPPLPSPSPTPPFISNLYLDLVLLLPTQLLPPLCSQQVHLSGGRGAESGVQRRANHKWQIVYFWRLSSCT